MGGAPLTPRLCCDVACGCAVRGPEHSTARRCNIHKQETLQTLVSVSVHVDRPPIYLTKYTDDPLEEKEAPPW